MLREFIGSNKTITCQSTNTRFTHVLWARIIALAYTRVQLLRCFLHISVCALMGFTNHKALTEPN